MNWAKNDRVRAVFVEEVKILENKSPILGDGLQLCISKDLMYHWDDIGKLTELTKFFYAQFSKGG